MAAVTRLRWEAAPARPGPAVLRPSPAVLRRRRFVVAGAVVATVLTCVALAGGLGAGSPGRPSPGRPSPGAGRGVSSLASPGSPPAGVKVYLVQPGDTLWGIATRLAPDADPRPLMDRLAAQVPGGVLQVGQRLVLP